MVTREPMHMFQGVFDADSQFTEKEKNMRPDLYIHGKRDSAYISTLDRKGMDPRGIDNYVFV